MTRPLPASLRLVVLAVFGLVLFLPPIRAQQPAKAPAANVGQFFTVVEPINDAEVEALRNEALALIEREAARGSRPILIFEFVPGDEKPGQSGFGSASDLAVFLAHKLPGAGQVVAYVPEPMRGYAVLPILACDEIVLGPNAALGPITPQGGAVTARERETVRQLAKDKGRDPDLLLGMLDPDADLREVRTADRQVHYVLASDLEEFKKTHTVLSDQPAWEGGRRGVLTAEKARRGFAQLIAEDRAKVADAYGLASTANDPTLGAVVNPILIKIEGQLDQVKESYLLRRIGQARQERVNLIFFAINSEGGLNGPADKIADVIAHLKDIKTVAYIDDRALGVSALVALACDEIVFRKGARMGDVTKILDGRRIDDLEPRLVEVLARRAADLARENGHSPALARAMVDPDTVVYQARDAKTGAVAFITEEQKDAEPGRYTIQETAKEAGEALSLTADRALATGLASRVVDDLDGLKRAYNLRGRTLRSDGPTWVDSLVATLNTPWMSWLLLFIGMFMLILELKLPGVGLPAIASALAFLLFFWGHYLGGTADQLEILLFLVGLICLALELFVFPGFGVFGMSGILLVLISVVMASHTFVWPTQEYEYRQMGRTLLQVTIAILAVSAGAVVLGRYFPSLPLFNRMVLKPEPLGGPEEDLTRKPPVEAEGSLFFLIGETGRTTTVLKPTGRARFGELLVDVTADGFFIEANQLVEVVEVQGSKVVVRKV
ncbi:MAG: serine protease [Isosphaeraceae bacterium]|nr:serine protease [Isosphaeraceae bacterium]